MKRLSNSISRAWTALRNIFSGLTNKITKGTGTATRTIGGAIGAGAAFLVLMCILVIVAIAAIPYGAFAAGADSTTQQASQGQACQRCGQVDVPLFKHEEAIVCGDCLRDSKPPSKKEKDNVAKDQETS